MIKPILQQNKQNTLILGRHLRMPHPLAAKLWSTSMKHCSTSGFMC